MGQVFKKKKEKKNTTQVESCNFSLVGQQLCDQESCCKSG